MPHPPARPRPVRACAGYPARLAGLGRPPAAALGPGRLPRRRSAVGGDRRRPRPPAAPAASGRARWPPRCGRQGYAVVSGGAFGIDAAAHQGALEAGAPTFAVLGCGVDVVYPDRHGRAVRSRSPRAGGLLSEYPPGTPPRRGQFPARNRIIAALADVVIVVEAAWRSGALITAAVARGLGGRCWRWRAAPGTDRLLGGGARLRPSMTRSGRGQRARAAGRPAGARRCQLDLPAAASLRRAARGCWPRRPTAPRGWRAGWACRWPR